MPLGEKHKGLVKCLNCPKYLNSVFGGGIKIEGYGYCPACKQIFEVSVKAIGEAF